MAKWRVWNKHPDGFTHREKFRENLIEIKGGAYVVMDYEDAVQFRGQYFPMKRRPTGEPDPVGFKVLHLEPHDADDAPAAQEFICHFDGAKFPTQAMLDNYLTQNFSDHVFKDEALEESIQKEETKKRGRPPKDKSA